MQNSLNRDGIFLTVWEQLIVNANYEFLMVDFGINARITDGGVLEYTRFYEKLVNQGLKLPKAEKLPIVTMSCLTYLSAMKLLLCEQIFLSLSVKET